MVEPKALHAMFQTHVQSLNLTPSAASEGCRASGPKIVMEDGTEGEIGPGDAAHIAPGHDAWTVGDEACVAVDFGGSSNYAKRQ
jgi:hypothetical protein